MTKGALVWDGEGQACLLPNTIKKKKKLHRAGINDQAQEWDY